MGIFVVEISYKSRPSDWPTTMINHCEFSEGLFSYQGDGHTPSGELGATYFPMASLSKEQNVRSPFRGKVFRATRFVGLQKGPETLKVSAFDENQKCLTSTIVKTKELFSCNDGEFNRKVVLARGQPVIGMKNKELNFRFSEDSIIFEKRQFLMGIFYILPGIAAGSDWSRFKKVADSVPTCPEN